MAKTFRDIEVGEVFLNEDINIPGQARENIRFRLTGRGSAVTGGGKPISPTETIITSKPKLSKRDYVATIEEVIDSNRVRVSLSYNDGVNLVKHKGDDQVSNRFKNFRVNYVKNNIDRYKTYVKIDNDYYLVINSKINEEGTQRVVKLKQPLQPNVETGDKFTIVEKRLETYRDRIRLFPYEETQDDGLFLRLPNFNSIDNPINFQGTNYQTHTELVSSNDEDSRDIERILVSGSLLNVQPNIDYQKTTTDLNLEADDAGFGNFVHFSNAETRLENFKKKLELIEGYNSESSSLVSVTSSLSTIQEIERKRQRVKNSFDPFEHYMYFESSSFVSSSAGLFHDTAWPKTNSTKPYTLQSVSAASDWFSTRIASASQYDQSNMNSLRNSLPEHIYADTQNNVFLEFMDMVGQQFDEIWTYTKSITDLNVRVDKLSEGISKDVAIHYANALGLNLYNGNDIMILPEYLLGKASDGSDLYESPQEEVTENIWKRILANLPFFIKSKGTERALKGLLNCYGIPSTMLRVREYGGPDKGTRVSYEIKRKFTRALDFRNSESVNQFIKVPYTASIKPQTLEFRFRTPEAQDQVILQRDNAYAFQLVRSGSTEYGFLRFVVSASSGVSHLDSSAQRFFTDDMWSVMLTRVSSSGDSIDENSDGSGTYDYELTTKKYDSTKQRIIYQSSASLGVSGSVSASYNNQFINDGDIFLGGSGSAFGTNFSGSLMEFRMWSEPLSQSVFDNHVRTPKAYNGNTTASSHDNLQFRLPLDDNRNYSGSLTSLTASNVAHFRDLDRFPLVITGSDISGFTGNQFRTLIDQEKVRVPNVGPTRRNATKIRIEETTLSGSTLLVDQRRELSNDDFAPKDDHTLGIYFSPTDVVNEDIIYSLADISFDDYIGDPRDEFKPTYKNLRNIRREYFRRYDKTNNFFDYLRILQFYDSSVYDSLQQLVPARAKTNTGVLIEPHILERSKQVIGLQPEFDNQYFENANEYDDGILVTRFISGSDNNYFIPSGEYTTYNGLINAAFFDTGSSLGFLNNRSIMILDGIDRKGEYGTLYATASISSGSHNNIFTEVLQPNISSSRLSETAQIEQFFYSSSLSASIGPTLAYSSSFEKADVESMALSTGLFRSFVQGIKITRDNSIDGEDAVIVNEVAPTVLKTQDSETSKLRTE